MLPETSAWAQKTRAQDTLFDSYVGIHAEKYRLAQELLHSRSGKLIWNWPAALLGPVWLYYRKFYLLLFMWLLIGVPFDFVYFAAAKIDSSHTNPLISIVINHYVLISVLFVVATNIFCGGWGTYYYLQKAERTIDMVRAHTPHSIAEVLLSQKGNPSLGRLFVGAGLLGGIYLSTYLLAQIWQIGNFTI